MLHQRRWIALFLAVVMSVSLMALPVSAAETDSGMLAEEPAVEPEETVEPTETPVEEDAPAATPEATVEPAAEPEETVEPTETPAEEDKPAEMPEATVEPAAEPEETVEPTETPMEEDAPAETPEATVEPTAQPEETAEPTVEPTAQPEELLGPSEEMAIVEDAAPSPDGEAESFVVSYYDGETLLGEETVLSGGKPVSVPVSDKAGRTISGWKTEDGTVVVPGEVAVTAAVSYYAIYAPALESTDHIRYINGIGGAMFGPNRALSRAQAATILYNLLTSKEMGPAKVSFSDVSENAWYYEAVMTLASYKVLSGYEDGTFRPELSVSRAEFVTMLVRLFGVTEKTSTFSDAKGHWAESFIATAAKNGWITGYDGNTFRPGKSITRAEAVVIVNRALKRLPDKTTLATGENILRYVDVAENAWYFWDVMEASIGHEYTQESGVETWTDYTVESCGLEPGLQTVGSKRYLVSAETNQLIYLKAGINPVDGEWYYAKKDGFEVNAVLSELELKAGFNTVDGKLFYWDTSKKAPLAVKAGLNKIAGKTYYADTDGYIINNTFGAGVVQLGGKYYISDGYCAIITSYDDYTSGTAVETDLKNSTYEYEKSMYYLQEDYSLAIDKWVGYLYFGKDGKYTTGDATLDNYVYDAVSGFIDNNALTKEEKLLSAYYYIRGGRGSDPLPRSGFGYLNRGDGYYRMAYDQYEHIDWLQECAKTFFRTKVGSCYYWAGAYLYMARRLGFQSYVEVGNLENDYPDSAPNRHCWCMIYWDGYWHISDVETEWGYLNRWYGSNSYYYNLFAQTVSSKDIKYYENPERPAICYYFK